MRSFLLLFTGFLTLAAACGGKTAGVIVGGDGGSPSSSRGSGSSSGSSSGATSGSGSGGAPGNGCSYDGEIPCAGGSQGYFCVAGYNPDTPTVSCVSAGANAYCCSPGSFGTTGCVPDDAIPSCGAGAYGFQCQTGDDPTAFDSSLDCSAPTPDPDGVHDDFCCVFTSGSSSSSGGSGSGGGPAGCTADPVIDCSGGADGYECAAGDNPEAENTSLSCGTPIASADGADDYCCFAGFPGNSTTCEPDDDLTTVCPDPDSYGYQCAAGDEPTSYDPHLNCSASTPDPDGVHDDFCCAFD